ncbi:MAG TPA: hypothetical protein VFM05_09320 [Candidatus Saccharimonadales bacterium]|nr:hypothetical protein [Candidatus Saccharimonadales bacterium]
MDPHANQTPGLGLPQPSFNMPQPSVGYAPGAFHAPDLTPHQQGSMPVSSQSMGAAAPSLPAIAPMPQAAPLASTPTDSNSDATIQADDDSALDEEWVNKAREIVERTHNDPYLQGREISKIKAQYIKVRYNKDIKGTDDQP